MELAGVRQLTLAAASFVVGIDLGREPVPDETTILNFRHLLERHNLGRELLGNL